MIQTKPCPRCGHKHGWWEKRQYHYSQCYDARGIPTYAEGRGSGGIVGSRKYCMECNKDITSCISEKETKP
jgi:hypothetical protein